VAEGSRLGAGVVVERYPEFYRSPRVFMACGRGGYVGLVRVEDGRLNLATALDPDFVKTSGGVGPATTRILDEAGFPAIPELDAAPWHGTPLLTRSSGLPAGERIFLLGDAAGYVEPFTGEGIAWALACGRGVAPLALRAIRQWDDSLIVRWASVHRRMVTRRQWVIRLLAQMLRRPLLARLIVRSLARLPALASPFVRYLNAIAPSV
jgi:2-polyprenyl-6-methoxyphenol hydroxylase-like FAD-dependent oxidoreductase